MQGSGVLGFGFSFPSTGFLQAWGLRISCLSGFGFRVSVGFAIGVWPGFRFRIATFTQNHVAVRALCPLQDCGVVMPPNPIRNPRPRTPTFESLNSNSGHPHIVQRGDDGIRDSCTSARLKYCILYVCPVIFDTCSCARGLPKCQDSIM